MAQINGLVRERVTFIGSESTFGTASGSFVPAVMLGTDLAVDGLAYEMLDNLDERSRRLEAQPKVIGLPIGSKLPGLAQYLQTVPNAAQLTAAGAVTALSTRKLLLAGYGTEHAALGTTTAATQTAGDTQITLTSDANFAIGTWCAVVTTAGLERVKILAKPGANVVMLQHALVGNVASGAAVKNLYNFVPAESHTSSLSVRRAFTADATAQYEAVGVHGTIGWEFPEFGKLAMLKPDFACIGFEGPLAQSIATTSQTNDMGAPFKWAPTMYLAPTSAAAQTVTTLSFGTPFVFESIEFAFANAFEMVRDGGAFATFTDATTQQTTVSAVVNTAGRPVAGTFTVKARYDGDASTGYDARFNAETDFQMVLVQVIGTGINATVWLWECPVARLAAKPKLTAVGSRMYTTLMFEIRQDTAVTAASGDLQQAPIRVAFG